MDKVKNPIEILEDVENMFLENPDLWCTGDFQRPVFEDEEEALFDETIEPVGYQYCLLGAIGLVGANDPSFFESNHDGEKLSTISAEIALGKYIDKEYGIGPNSVALFNDEYAERDVYEVIKMLRGTIESLETGELTI